MTDRATDAVFVISVAAEITGVHPQTLRIYERRGLIEPYRTPGGTRRYSQRDLDRLASIQHLTAQGMNLEGVRQVLDLQEEVERLQRQVRRLRRLLGEAEARAAGTAGRARHAASPRMSLPDVRRPTLRRLLED